ncbi:MAG: hypothetical protein ACRC8A_12360 [Microcoleaceae cyanobacterium]
MATATLNETLPLSGQIFEISADVTEPLMIENFDRTQDVITISDGQKNYKSLYCSFSQDTKWVL